MWWTSFYNATGLDLKSKLYELKLKVYSEGEMEEEILGKGVRPGIQALSVHLPEGEEGGGEKLITTWQLLRGL